MSDLALIYILQRADGALKVGITQQLGLRVATLKHHHGELMVVDARPVLSIHMRLAEAIAHGELEGSRVEGEWFSCTKTKARSAVDRGIREAASGRSIPDNIAKRRSIAAKARYVPRRVAIARRKVEPRRSECV